MVFNSNDALYDLKPNCSLFGSEVRDQAANRQRLDGCPAQYSEKCDLESQNRHMSWWAAGAGRVHQARDECAGRCSWPISVHPREGGRPAGTHRPDLQREAALETSCFSDVLWSGTQGSGWSLPSLLPVRPSCFRAKQGPGNHSIIRLNKPSSSSSSFTIHLHHHHHHSYSSTNTSTFTPGDPPSSSHH
jgi:hypothetical protein